MIYLASPYWHPDAAVRNQRFRAACRATAVLLLRGKWLLPNESTVCPPNPMYELGVDPLFWGAG